ncbi:MAG: hypothetical protein JO235_21810 [Chroococcidiopsidaceae cyanobacterium CP_BM_RX_35]|nr:hypothetical protein [Chroococcidiopsidaceae cyanobacterium CP_BM_RX_35]
MHPADSLPPIHLILFDSAPVPEWLPAPPQDSRSLRVEEFLKAREA